MFLILNVTYMLQSFRSEGFLGLPSTRKGYDNTECVGEKSIEKKIYKPLIELGTKKQLGDSGIM